LSKQHIFHLIFLFVWVGQSSNALFDFAVGHCRCMFRVSFFCETRS